MSLYDEFTKAILQSNRNIVITFFAALGIVIGYGVLSWLPLAWQSIAKKIYLAWWLIIFVMFYFLSRW